MYLKELNQTEIEIEKSVLFFWSNFKNFPQFLTDMYVNKV